MSKHTMDDLFMTAEEFCEMHYDPFENVKYWKLVKSNQTLVCTKSPNIGYEIDLERCLTFSQVLDWIMFVFKNIKIPDEVFTDFVRALNGVLNLQQNYCSFGRDMGEKSKADIRRFINEL